MAEPIDRSQCPGTRYGKRAATGTRRAARVQRQRTSMRLSARGWTRQIVRDRYMSTLFNGGVAA